VLLRELLAGQNVDDLRSLTHQALNSGSIDDRWHHSSPSDDHRVAHRAPLGGRSAFSESSRFLLDAPRTVDEIIRPMAAASGSPRTYPASDSGYA
jgi:hypothetical protein